MESIFARTQMLFGAQGMECLACAHVAVFGLGGVGGQAAETLVRAGVGQLTICDNDTVSNTNRNRQLFATAYTTGMVKTEAAAERLLAVNPDLKLHRRTCFFDRDTASAFDFSAYDYVLDCIDTVTSKLLLIDCCAEAGTPLLACLGTGNKTDPTRLQVSDISKTSVCPLARVMRLECKKRGYCHYRVVWSDEMPQQPDVTQTEELLAKGRRSIPASTPFVPPAAGILMARTCVMDLLSGGCKSLKSGVIPKKYKPL
ncbi:MAG: tRNA threonylcarbamoyladenosine dehydratase [Clostridia bacterium]|nr:tRNA threonylcarbamoyladenosine dehydratase [Clostridia bacterium]